jgi:hypothetical protein
MYKKRGTNQSLSSKDNRNENNRKRNVIVNFRMSPQEKEILDSRIKLSGLKKQEYMINSVLYQKIVTVGNIRVYEEIWKFLLDINNTLSNPKAYENMDAIKISSLKTISEIISGLGKFEELSIDYERQLDSYKKKVHNINNL